MKKLILLLPLFLLVGCEKRETLGSRQIEVEVVSVKLQSKSNSKVTLKDVDTGTIYGDVRLRCTKSEAANVKIGSRWSVYGEDYRYGDSPNTDIAAKGICINSQP